MFAQALALIPNNKHKSDLGRKRIFHLCLPLFPCLLRQSGGYGLKYFRTKQREAVDVCPAIISGSLRDIICCVLICTMNLPEENRRRSVQRWEWRGGEGSLGAYGQPTQLF